ncbi:hypothetical protein N7453_009696 [Penicillium expansum]|nr:hypothetical protein N7453_009696 [Penicillium expansum]
MADDLASESGSDASSLPFGANYSDSQSNTSTVVSGRTSEYVSSETSEDRDFIVDDTESISDSQSSSSASDDADIESLNGEAGYLVKERVMIPIKAMGQRFTNQDGQQNVQYLVLWYSWESADSVPISIDREDLDLL